MALRGDRRIDQVKEGMRSEKIKVFGVGVGIRRRHRPLWNGVPIQQSTPKMRPFHLLPQPKTVQALFEPVMIPGHYGEPADEA
jgi:hypothetical protein